MGADKWQRTGVLTFDGNANIKEEVTYRKIQEHLKEVYGRHFVYGTVVELCVARNKHRCSAKRYRGLANVTSRRVRKGFTLKYNPDTHWSAAFYKALGQIQYIDGRNIMLNINRPLCMNGHNHRRWWRARGWYERPRSVRMETQFQCCEYSWQMGIDCPNNYVWRLKNLSNARVQLVPKTPFSRAESQIFGQLPSGLAAIS